VLVQLVRIVTVVHLLARCVQAGHAWVNPVRAIVEPKLIKKSWINNLLVTNPICCRVRMQMFVLNTDGACADLQMLHQNSTFVSKHAAFV
jgi:hypothetical protein